MKYEVVDIEHYEIRRYLISNINSICARDQLNVSNYIWNYILRYPGADEYSIIYVVIGTTWFADSFLQKFSWTFKKWQR